MHVAHRPKVGAEADGTGRRFGPSEIRAWAALGSLSKLRRRREHTIGRVRHAQVERIDQFVETLRALLAERARTKRCRVSWVTHGGTHGRALSELADVHHDASPPVGVPELHEGRPPIGAPVGRSDRTLDDRGAARRNGPVAHAGRPMRVVTPTEEGLEQLGGRRHQQRAVAPHCPLKLFRTPTATRSHRTPTSPPTRRRREQLTHER